MQKYPPIDLFVHIPKTAGTTMIQLLMQNYPQAGTFNLGSIVQQRITEFKSLTPDQQNNYQLVVGHMSYGLHEYIAPSRSYRYFTMMRDPVERVLSLYYFIRRNPGHYLHEAIVGEDLTIPEFLNFQDLYLARNGQTRFLCGLDVMPYYGPVDEQSLALAKSHIEKNILVTGLTEFFDESLLLFKHVFGWKRINYSKQNVTYNRAQQEDLPGEFLAAIRAHNNLDMELYHFAREKFEKQVAAYGPGFESDLAKLRRTNQYVNLIKPLQHLVQRVRAVSLRNHFKN